MLFCIQQTFMPIYRFVILKKAARIEGLRVAKLADDALAFAFGERVIRDMTHGDHRRYVGWTFEITEGEREVSAIAFDAEAEAKK